LFFDLESELSIRMLHLIQSCIKLLKSSEVSILAVLVGEAKISDERLKYITFPILLDQDMATVKQFIPDIVGKKDVMPSILLLNKNSEIMLWKEGYNLAIHTMLVDAANSLLGGKPVAAALNALQDEVKTKEVDLVGLDYAKKGFDCLGRGDYSKAVEYYKEAADAFPEASEVWYNYACALSRNNDIDEAFIALGRALELGYRDSTWMKKDPDLENLRKDARFGKIVK
jgi:tetratricopeptide (TPR) repeat protein